LDRRPLIVVRGDSLRLADARRIADVTRDALAMRPDARFDVVAITANRGGDPRQAQSARDSVARTLVEAGAAGERVDVSAEVSTFLPANEVHVFLR
jgi:hypothetical protein